jgi:hypothetical protein
MRPGMAWHGVGECPGCLGFRVSVLIRLTDSQRQSRRYLCARHVETNYTKTARRTPISRLPAPHPDSNRRVPSPASDFSDLVRQDSEPLDRSPGLLLLSPPRNPALSRAARHPAVAGPRDRCLNAFLLPRRTIANWPPRYRQRLVIALLLPCRTSQVLYGAWPTSWPSSRSRGSQTLS